MKVKELIEKLNSMDPDLDVLCYTEDESLVGKENLGRALEVIEISRTDMEVSRNEDGVVQIKFTSSELSKPYVLFEITSDL